MPERDRGAAASQARAFFGRHAADYAKSEGHRSGEDLAVALEALGPVHGLECLDLATGTGFFAVALARAGARVTAVDLTAEMLDQARLLARDEAVEVAFEQADASRLPFADAAFDRVGCRRAAHHFDDLPAVLAEVRRVLRPGGRLAVADMSPPPAAAAFQDRIERLRDPSHRHALTPDEWREALMAAGFEAVEVALTHERQSFDRWYYPVTDRRARARIEAAMAEAPPAVAEALGLVREASGAWSLLKQRAIVAGRRTA